MEIKQLDVEMLSMYKDDIDAIGKEYLTLVFYIGDWNVEVFLSFWIKMLETKNAVIFGAFDGVNLVGLLCAVVYNDFISGKKVLDESVWMVKKYSRGCGMQLLSRFRDYATEIKAERLVLGHGRAKEKIFRKFLKRLGFHEYEVRYIKEVGVKCQQV